MRRSEIGNSVGKYDLSGRKNFAAFHARCAARSPTSARGRIIMKRRLYYLADHLDTADRVAAILARQGLSEWRLHVLSRDEAGVYKHHLHDASPLLTRDIWRQGGRGALLGFVMGIIATALIIGVFGFFRNHIAVASIVIIGLVTMHGAWIGGLTGINHENYKIRRFHDDIERGRVLLMLDLATAERDRVQRELRQLPLQACGDDDIVVLPFEFQRRNHRASSVQRA